MSSQHPDVPGLGEGLETQAPLEEVPAHDEPDDSADPDDAGDTPDEAESTEHRDDQAGHDEPTEAEVLHDQPPADEVDEADEGGAAETPAGPPA